MNIAIPRIEQAILNTQALIKENQLQLDRLRQELAKERHWVWVAQDGRETEVGAMETSHILNCIRTLGKRVAAGTCDRHRFFEKFADELEIRLERGARQKQEAAELCRVGQSSFNPYGYLSAAQKTLVAK